jgi:hypothetical protein
VRFGIICKNAGKLDLIVIAGNAAKLCGFEHPRAGADENRARLACWMLRKTNQNELHLHA